MSDEVTWYSRFELLIDKSPAFNEVSMTYVTWYDGDMFASVLICVRAFVHMCARVCAYVCACFCIYVRTFVHMCVSVYVFMCVRLYICVWAFVYLCAYVCTYVCARLCICARLCFCTTYFVLSIVNVGTRVCASVCGCLRTCAGVCARTMAIDMRIASFGHWVAHHAQKLCHTRDHGFKTYILTMMITQWPYAVT